MPDMDTPGRVRGSKVQSTPLRDRALRSAFMGKKKYPLGGSRDRVKVSPSKKRGNSGNGGNTSPNPLCSLASRCSHCCLFE